MFTSASRNLPFARARRAARARADDVPRPVEPLPNGSVLGQPGLAEPGIGAADVDAADVDAVGIDAVGIEAAAVDEVASPLKPGEPAVLRTPKRARLGRNLVAAILVGSAMGGTILSSLLIVQEFFVVVLAVSAAVATWELAGALRRGAGIEVPLPVLLVGGQAMIWLAWPFGTDGLAAAFGITMVAAFLWRMRGGASHYVRDVSATVFCAAYVPLCCGFAVLMTVAPDGMGRILTFMLPVVASDVGGYAAGVLAGRHPMAPTISPKKSWEGFAGSQIAGMTTGALCVTVFLGGPWWVGVLVGSLLVVSGTLGDLVESMIKRDLGIKDMGNLLPGHGGLMDRLDSMLPTAVVAWLLLTLLVPV